MTLVYEKPQEDISAYLEQPDEYLSLDIRRFAEVLNCFFRKKETRRGGARPLYQN